MREVSQISRISHYREIFPPVLSRKFCSAEKFGPGPIFSGKIVPDGTVFSEKNGPVLKILFRVYFSLKIDCNSYMMHKSLGSNIDYNLWLETTKFDFISQSLMRTCTKHVAILTIWRVMWKGKGSSSDKDILEQVYVYKTKNQLVS